MQEQNNEQIEPVAEPVEETAKTELSDTAPFSVVVTFGGNTQFLVSMLTNLQAQLIPPHKIIIIDSSANKAGLDLAQRFSTQTTEILVECVPGEHNIQHLWNLGIDLAGNDDVLICNDDLLLPMNLTDMFMIAKQSVKALCYVPLTPAKTHYADYVTNGFNWYAKLPDSLEDFAVVNWMPGFCYYLTRELINAIGTFDEKFECWFGDDDYQMRILEHSAKTGIPGIVRLNTCFVYHFGGKSYKYKSKEVQERIDRDRIYFGEKYGVKEDATN